MLIPTTQTIRFHPDAYVIFFSSISNNDNITVVGDTSTASIMISDIWYVCPYYVLFYANYITSALTDGR